MAGDAFIGKGTQLLLDGTPVARVVSVSGPNATVGTVETTHLGSTSKEFLPTMSDWGEITATIRYSPAQATHASLTALIGTPTVEDWSIVFPNVEASTMAFSAMLTAFNVQGVEVEGVVDAEITLKISGAVTITA